MSFEIVHETIKDGFNITLSILPEETPLDWDFESEEERQEFMNKINNGYLLYFVAKVEASKLGIALGIDYLGGCVYRDIQEFLEDGYFADMVDNAILEAKTNLINLCKEL